MILISTRVTDRGTPEFMREKTMELCLSVGVQPFSNISRGRTGRGRVGYHLTLSITNKYLIMYAFEKRKNQIGIGDI